MMRHQNGYTIVEMAIAVTTLGIVMIAMMSVLRNSVQTAQTSSLSVPAEREARQALLMIGKDLDSAIQSSLGSAVRNSSFEEMDNNMTKGNPRFWDDDSLPVGRMRYLTTVGDDRTAHSGFSVIRLARTGGNDTRYSSTGETNKHIRLLRGHAYQIVAYVKRIRGQANNCQFRLRLVRSSARGVVLGQRTFEPNNADPDDEARWHRVSFRYPLAASDNGTGGVITGRSDPTAVIELGILNGDGVYLIDDVSVTPIKKTLASPFVTDRYYNKDYVHSLVNDETSAWAGFRFEKTNEGQVEHYRYLLLDEPGEGKVLVRQRYDFPRGWGRSLVIHETVRLASWTRQLTFDYLTPDLDIINNGRRGYGNGDLDDDDIDVMENFISQHGGVTETDMGDWNPYFDIDRNGIVNEADLALVKSIVGNETDSGEVVEYLSRKERPLRILFESDTPLGYDKSKRVRKLHSDRALEM